MTDAWLLAACGCVVLSGALGYLVGRHQAHLLNRIRTLEGQAREPEPEKPTVTMGAYTPAVAVSEDNDKPVGVVEAKTPQRVEWEAEQAIEKEGLGIVPH